MKNFRVSIGFRNEGSFETLELATAHASTLSGSVVKIKDTQVNEFKYCAFHHSATIYSNGWL